MTLAIDVSFPRGPCNLSCRYCVGRKDPAFGPGDAAALLETVTRALRRWDAPLVRLSGGEILLLRDLVPLVRRLRDLGPAVEIVTNGTLLDARTIDAFAELGGVHLKISLDGHLHEMNAHRFPHRSQFEAVYGRFQHAARSRLGVAVFTVISAANAARIEEFVRELSRLPRPVPVYFLPVRHAFGRVEKAGSGAPFDALADAYPRHEEVIFSREYVRSVAAFLRAGSRAIDCFAVRHVVGLDASGAIASCPCGLPGRRGSLTNAEPLVPRRQLHRSGFCRGCFTDYDVLGLAMRGDVTVGELGKDPVYRDARVRSRVVELASRWAGAAPAAGGSGASSGGGRVEETGA